MPRPTDQQITYMALCVMTELDDVARRAAATAREAVSARDRLGEIIRTSAELTPEVIEQFLDRADRVGAEVREVEGNVQNLRYSEYALNLARRSMS